MSRTCFLQNQELSGATESLTSQQAILNSIKWLEDAVACVYGDNM